MRTLNILILAGCLLSFNEVAAQQTKPKMLDVVTITATGTDVNAKVSSAFQKSFKGSENMRWYAVNRNYLVKFIQDDQQHKALFAKNGRLIYHVAYGYEKNLPAMVRHQIKSTYHDYNISRVFHVNQDNRNIWLINLMNKDYLIMARVEDGEMNMVNRLKNLTADYTVGLVKK